MIDRVIAARPGPNSTFAEQEAAAAAIEVEVLAELARREAAAAAIEVEVLAELARREAEAGSPGDKD